MTRVTFSDCKKITLEDVESFCEVFPDLSIVIDNGKEITFILGEEQ